MVMMVGMMVMMMMETKMMTGDDVSIVVKRKDFKIN